LGRELRLGGATHTRCRYRIIGSDYGGVEKRDHKVKRKRGQDDGDHFYRQQKTGDGRVEVRGGSGKNKRATYRS